MTHPLALLGNYGSPYSLKMRAVLRYRHIPFRWMLRGSKWDDLPAAPVAIIPVIGFPDADGAYTDVMVDSSPQIMRLEREFECFCRLKIIDPWILSNQQMVILFIEQAVFFSRECQCFYCRCTIAF